MLHFFIDLKMYFCAMWWCITINILYKNTRGSYTCIWHNLSLFTCTLFFIFRIFRPNSYWGRWSNSRGPVPCFPSNTSTHIAAPFSQCVCSHANTILLYYNYLLIDRNVLYCNVTVRKFCLLVHCDPVLKGHIRVGSRMWNRCLILFHIHVLTLHPCQMTKCAFTIASLTLCHCLYIVSQI